MADNVESDAGSGGAVFATDDISSVHHPYVKLEFGPADTATIVTATEGLPVTSENFKLAANSGVDIGDVDVTSLLPGSGATNLGKLEDAVHSSGDLGVMALVVRNDSLAALAGADGDYAPLQVNSSGALFIQEGSALDVSAATLTVNAHAVTNAGTFVVQEDGAALTALQLIDNIVSVEDAAHGSGDSGVMALGVRKDTPGALTNADGDYAPLQVDATGSLVVTNAPSTKHGHTSYLNQDTSAVDTVKGSGGTVYWISCMSIDATPVYLNLYDSTTATLGSTTPTNQFIAPSRKLNMISSVVNIIHTLYS